MISTIYLLAIASSVLMTSGHDTTSSFQDLVCLQYRSVCGTEQHVEVRPRVGKAGPRGVAGPVGPPGVINLTAIEELVDHKIAAAFEIRQNNCQDVNFVFSELRNETGDVFRIYPSKIGLSSMFVYCDMKTDGGGWLVFQRRMDGTEDFYREWNEYVIGFGDNRKEFWLGLQLLHKFTEYHQVELRIDMVKRDGARIHAKYSNFKVASSSDNYRLTVGGYSGNSSDRLSYHNNQQFSTKDNDNDPHSSNCAKVYKGAWWYNSCHHSNLNGNYRSDFKWWGGFLSFSEMKIRLRK